jgi:oxygen-independent coproporphyrinogen-3 oxidase
LYIKSLEATGSETATIIEKEILTSIQQLNEYIMISLRTMEGSDLRFVAEKFGSEIALELEKRAQRYVQEGKMTNQGTISLTRSGKLLADRITADLFFE